MTSWAAWKQVAVSVIMALVVLYLLRVAADRTGNPFLQAFVGVRPV